MKLHPEASYIPETGLVLLGRTSSIMLVIQLFLLEYMTRWPLLPQRSFGHGKIASRGVEQTRDWARIDGTKGTFGRGEIASRCLVQT